MYRFNGFTENANKAMNMAIDCAQQLGHTYIGTEHILLGLLQESSGVASVALENSGVTFEAVEQNIKEKIGVGSMTRLTTADLTPQKGYSNGYGYSLPTEPQLCRHRAFAYCPA